jgi:hypothetical protein
MNEEEYGTLGWLFDRPSLKSKYDSYDELLPMPIVPPTVGLLITGQEQIPFTCQVTGRPLPAPARPGRASAVLSRIRAAQP